jgi:hypothetical protein
MTATLSLRALKPLCYGLLVSNFGPIVGTLTEGGHDAVDSLGGIATALAAYWLAQKLLAHGRDEGVCVETKAATIWRGLDAR